MSEVGLSKLKLTVTNTPPSAVICSNLTVPDKRVVSLVASE